MPSLTKRDWRILELRFDEELTHDEIADKYNITRERVRFILAGAVKKLITVELARRKERKGNEEL